MSATNRNITYSRCKATNSWLSFDAHDKNGAVTVLLAILPIQAANTSIMNNNEQVTGEVPHLQDHKS